MKYQLQNANENKPNAYNTQSQGGSNTIKAAGVNAILGKKED
jgi:hypothetical protein